MHLKRKSWQEPFRWCYSWPRLSGELYYRALSSTRLNPWEWVAYRKTRQTGARDKKAFPADSLEDRFTVCTSGKYTWNLVPRYYDTSLTISFQFFHSINSIFCISFRTSEETFILKISRLWKIIVVPLTRSFRLNTRIKKNRERKHWFYFPMYFKGIVFHALQ